ncbi:hypothetical protein HYS90_02760 [Candidatus Curtissbacteria bacterium]|nr:hypothetical protein [Candidatus Curtissbacteria bacterium]
MSNRIESKQPLQLTFPEPSTVIVVPKGRREDTSQGGPKLLTSERLMIGQLIPPVVIHEVTQEILERGLDADIDRGTTDLVLAMAEARQKGITHQDFEKFLDENFKIMRQQVGSTQPRLDEAREHILKIAELMWTTISDEEVDEILQGQTVPFPQKRQ